MGVNSWQHLRGLRKSGSEVNLQHEFTEIDIQRRLISISSSMKAEKKMKFLLCMVWLSFMIWRFCALGDEGVFSLGTHVSWEFPGEGSGFNKSHWALVLQSFTQHIVISGKDVDLSVCSDTPPFFKALPVVPHSTVRFRDWRGLLPGYGRCSQLHMLIYMGFSYLYRYLSHFKISVSQ